MNLITNRCLGGYIYRDILKERYENPFIWTGIWDEYFNILFENYNSINFKNFKVCYDENHPVEKYYILIDNAIRVNYGHILLDPNAITPTPKDVNIYTNDPMKYVKEKYIERLERMTKPPTFIYMDLDYSNNYELADIALRKKQKLNILTVDEKFPTNEFINKQVIVKQDWTKIIWWQYLYNNCNKEINNLLKF